MTGRFNPTEQIGVTRVKEIFLTQFNWIPRVQLESDVGIDMIVETTVNMGMPTGRLIAIQIKAGESYFKERSRNKIVFRATKVHIDYWLNHSLPVIIVLHNQNANLTIWQAVNKESVINTGKNYKIEIPINQELSIPAKEKLSKINDHPPSIQRFIELSLYRHLMQKIRNGEKVVIDLEKWINKSSGRANLRIIQVINDFDYDERKERTEVLLSESTYFEFYSHFTLFQIFSWADFKTDMNFYEEFIDYDDSEGHPGYKTVFVEDKYHNYQLPIIPYLNDGEIEKYRLEMSLNNFGNSFLDFYNGLEHGIQLKLVE